MKNNVSVVGLGKLGSPFLATCASRGIHAIGLDVNEDFVKLINLGKAPVAEPHLAHLISQNRSNLEATSDWSYTVANSQITFVIVPTPSLKRGAFSSKYIHGAVLNIAKELKNKKGYHLIVIVSTIMPGTMDRVVVPVLQKYSGKVAGKDFGVCYSPEFIALGSVIKNLLEPDFVLIGQSDVKAGKLLGDFYRKFCTNKPPIKYMNLVNAEISKIALNSYITTKISFANTLAQVCESVIGGNVDDVTGALGMDSRIGNKYLKGGLPFGGPCFPRDNRAFAYFAKKLKLSAPLALATDKINNGLTAKLGHRICAVIPKKGVVAILGLSYKKNTDVVEESAGLHLANFLAKRDYHVKVWDPFVSKKINGDLLGTVEACDSTANCVKDADAVLISTDHDEFKNLDPRLLSNKKPILLDCWKILDPLKYQKAARYRAIGINSSIDE